MKSQELEIRALALLEEALDQPSGEREAWIAARTEDDFPLRARMMQLLAASAELSEQLLTGGAPLDSFETQAPERVGAYRIVSQVGHGGMGAVYKAQRDSGDFDHTVAIKLIRPGALSTALVERFKQERQILAELAHPNIARLFDGGTTMNGEPFIVMEYVDGEPIDRWVSARGLDTPARLRLFLSVCDAVRFAHQNLIVHRDITPPNVLVTADGTAKLIDFGISKPPEAGEGGRPATSSISGMSLTPGFAAPERASGAAATTLTDIYSLGRLLAALLEGQPPSADLAAIVAEASAPDPQARYASVDALMDDIDRYLTGRTVAARRGGRAYAISRFVGRHRWPVAGAATAFGLILAALATTLVFYASAENARAAEARRFDEVRTLAGFMLFQLNDDLARTPGNTAAREKLAAKAQQYLQVLAQSPDAPAPLRLEAARGFNQLAKIQGVPPEPNLGERALAKQNLALAERLFKTLAAQGVPAADWAPDLARTHVYQGLILALADTKIGEGDKALKAAEVVLNQVPAGQRSSAWHLTRGQLLRAQAEVRFLNAEDPKVVALGDQMDAELASWPEALRNGREGAEQRAYAEFYRASGNFFVNGGDYGIPAILKGRDAMRELDRRWPNDPATLYALTYLDYSLFASAARAGRQTLSSQAIADARASVERLLTLEANDNALITLKRNIDQAYAHDLANRGLFAQAIAVQRRAMAEVSALLTPEQRVNTLSDMAWTEMQLGVIGRKAGDRELTCTSYINALARFEAVEKRSELTGFHKGFMPGLRSNVALCRAGRPLSALKDLR
ncbi:MAG TPA: serine/threonine-protein kinase, partial [Caulobacter sp.]|nr:serine/threonine-protein kinase [Caulobacter sp.]